MVNIEMARDSKGVYFSSLELIREVRLSFGKGKEDEDCFESELES